MSTSNSTKIQNYLAAFDEVVVGARMTQVQRSTKAAQISDDMKNFGNCISHDPDMHASFIEAVKACQVKAGRQEVFAIARMVFEEILKP